MSMFILHVHTPINETVILPRRISCSCQQYWTLKLNLKPKIAKEITSFCHNNFPQNSIHLQAICLV